VIVHDIPVVNSEFSTADLILAETVDLRAQLLQHPIYARVADIGSLQTFMQHHVFAVLDFMWLLKRLQRDLCCGEIPWLPRANSSLARFVNEIVLGEETDENGRGGYCSHFEMYLEAMQDVGSDRTRIDHFVRLLSSRQSVSDGLQTIGAPESVRRFVEFTFRVANEGTISEVASVFCFGREDIIPEMFEGLLNSFMTAGMNVPRLSYYIRRHIELDGDHHGPLTRRLVNMVTDSPSSTRLALTTTRLAIQHRIDLWDGVLRELDGGQ
jgi:hypothetical protein